MTRSPKTLAPKTLAPMPRRIVTASSLLLAASVAAGPVFAREPAKQFGGVPYETIPSPRLQATPNDATITRRIDLSIGKSFVVDLPQDGGEVFVADPKVANAVVRTARKISSVNYPMQVSILGYLFNACFTAS